MDDAQKVAHAIEYAFWPKDAVPYNINFEHFKVLVSYVNGDWAKDAGQWVIMNRSSYWDGNDWVGESSRKAYYADLDEAIDIALREVEKIRLFDRSASEYKVKLTQEGYLK